MSKNTKRQKAEQTTTDDERLLVAENQIELLREQMEFWREQIENLNQELRHKEQQLQATEQELNYTNKELSSALMLERINQVEAKKFSKIILKSNKSASQSLAELLSAIYGSQVQPEELEQIDDTSIPLKTVDNNEMINSSKQVTAKSKALKNRHKELGYKFVMLQATSYLLHEKVAELIAKSREVTNANKARKNTFIKLSPPL